MEIREMKTEDVFIVADMEKRLFSDPWSFDSFKDSLKRDNMIFLVLEDEGKIAGYCGMMCVLDEGQILNIAVDTEYRRRGFATEMMLAMLEFGMQNGISLYTLEVRESNIAAITLYAGCGFAPNGRRKDYYSKPKEDAILMELDFADPETLKRLGMDE